jgi:hypothetical protein
MAATLTQALDALTKATHELAGKVATEGAGRSGQWLVAVTIALVLVTVFYAYQTYRLVRETRRISDATRKMEQERQQEEKRMVAGVLVAELHEHFVRVTSVLNPRLGKAEERSSDEAIAWCLDSMRTGFFDTAGSRLFLLGPDLLYRTTECYGLIRRTLDEARQAQSLAIQSRIHPFANERGTALSKAGQLAKKAHDSALPHGAEALTAIEALLPLLSAVAGIQDPLDPAEE